MLAYRIPHEYCAPRYDLGEHLEQALAQLPDEHEELMVFYGVAAAQATALVDTLQKRGVHVASIIGEVEPGDGAITVVP